MDRESCEHLRWTHLEQAQHCTDLPRQVTFPAHTEQGKMGPGLGINVTAHQQNEETKGRRKKKRKQATDFKEAVCCPSAVVQGGSIAKKSRRVPRVTGTLGKAKNHFDPTQTGSGTAPPR